MTKPTPEASVSLTPQFCRARMRRWALTWRQSMRLLNGQLPGPNVSPMNQLAEGALKFATDWRNRSQGKPTP
jgi:hypothetical protein